MILMAMLILAYGTPDWSFPWWLWVLGVLASISSVDDTIKRVRETVK